MKKTNLLLLALGFAATIACSKDEPTGTEPDVTTSVLIANEGSFSNGVGSITGYNTGARTTEKNLFQKANLVPPGNVLNQVYIDGDRTFLVMNGSGEVIMCNTNTLKVEGRFSDLGQPRKVLRITENKYYVTDWVSNVVFVLNATTKKVDKQVKVGIGPEDIVLHNNKVYVSNSGGSSSTGDNSIFVLNPATDMVEDTIIVEDNPTAMVIDRFDRLWVLCSGFFDFNTPINSTAANVVVIDLDSNEVIRALPFDDVSKKPNRMVTDNGNNVFFMEAYQGNLLKMNVLDTILPTSAFIEGSFYALGYDALNQEIYLGDPKDYVSNGSVFRYDKDAKLLDQFEVGLIPGSFGFK